MWPFGAPWRDANEERWFVVERGCGYRREVRQSKFIRFDKECSVKWVPFIGWGEQWRIVREED